MKLTKAKIKQAQTIIEAMLEECDIRSVTIYSREDYDDNVTVEISGIEEIYTDSVAKYYISRLHELNGTTPPPF